MPSFFKLLLPAGLLLLSCAAGFDTSSLQEKFSSNQQRWISEMDDARNAAYLVRFSATGPKGKAAGSLEIHWLWGDTVILFSPGLFGKGSLRGRWVLGESLLVYFPREKNYYKGSWEDFLLGIKSQNPALDSLVFAILSRRAFLAEASSNLPERMNGGWTLTDRLGGWERQFIFNRRGNLSKVNWRLSSPAVEAEAEMDKSAPGIPSAKRLEWKYLEQNVNAKFEVDRMVVNAEIPVSKKVFQIPKDAVRLERIETNEEN